MLARPDGGRLLVWAKQVVLASGGCGMVYRETTNPPVATGDGMAAAYRAGAGLRDMEFLQFHPTVLYVAGSARFLLTEAIRGEGAYLRDKDGQRFMLDVDPRAERATRDVVSRAIFATMERTQHPNVYLDLSHLDPAHVHPWNYYFTNMYDRFADSGSHVAVLVGLVALLIQTVRRRWPEGAEEATYQGSGNRCARGPVRRRRPRFPHTARPSSRP